MGHAGYAKKRLFGTEPDILCAAISVTGTKYHRIAFDETGRVKNCKLTQNEETGFIKCDFREFDSAGQDPYF